VAGREAALDRWKLGFGFISIEISAAWSFKPKRGIALQSEGIESTIELFRGGVDIQSHNILRRLFTPSNGCGDVEMFFFQI
jgi:hypothetical protein